MILVLKNNADQKKVEELKKQLEKDFGDAAYATIRSFVLKFADLGLLNAQKMKNKTVYSVQ